MSSTLHRFTPPTCTLEIKGVKSPLSRWTNQELLKKFQFQLSFDDPRLPTTQQVTVTGNKTELEELKTIVESYVQKYLHASLSSDTHSFKAPQSLLRPYLKPDGLVNHQFLLGNLKSDSTTNIVRLTTVQLFDLVTALEAYSAKIASLPTLQQKKSNKVIPLRSSIAAASIVTVGVGVAIVLLQPSSEQVANEKQSEPTSNNAQLDEVIPPQIPEEIRNKTSRPRLNQTISSGQRLPPPPAVNAPKPKPNIPDPADYPLAQVERQSSLNSPKKANPTQPQPQKTETDTTKRNNPTIASNKVQEDDNSNDNSQVETLILEPQQTKDNSSSPETEAIPSEDKAVTAPEQTTSGLSNILEIPPTESDVALNSKSRQLTQAAQIKAYFQDKWQPPEDLKQSLEYRLHLNDDGSIKKVIPLGKASRLYLSQTNIPVQGEPFIAPTTEENSIIRLLLNPDGEVKTFQE